VSKVSSCSSGSRHGLDLREYSDQIANPGHPREGLQARRAHRRHGVRFRCPPAGTLTPYSPCEITSPKTHHRSAGRAPRRKSLHKKTPSCARWRAPSQEQTSKSRAARCEHVIQERTTDWEPSTETPWPKLPVQSRPVCDEPYSLPVFFRSSKGNHGRSVLLRYPQGMTASSDRHAFQAKWHGKACAPGTPRGTLPGGGLSTEERKPFREGREPGGNRV
jgi:hypothetical protein